MDYLNPNQPNPIPMPVTPNPNTKLTAYELLKVFGYGYIAFCVTYVTLTSIFMAGYEIAKHYSH